MKKTLWGIFLVLTLLILIACEDESNIVEYQISFDTGTETIVLDDQIVKHGDLIKDPGNIERFGYKFAYWETEKLNRPWRFYNDIVISDMVLVAVWEQITLDLEFKALGSYNFFDGKIELELGVYFEDERLDLINDFKKITVDDGQGEKEYNLDGNNYITENILSNNPLTYKVYDYDDAVYEGIVYIENFYNSLSFNKTQDEVLVIEEQYFEEYEVLNNDGGVISLLNDNIYIADNNNDYIFNKYNNKYNTPNYLENISNDDTSYKMFIVNEDGSFNLGEFNYIKNTYYSITLDENISSNVTVLEKVLKGTMLDLEINVSEGKFIKEFKINDISFKDELINNKLTVDVNNDLNISLILEDIYYDVVFIIDDEEEVLKVKYNDLIDESLIPETYKPGYEFDGWFKDDDIFDLNTNILFDIVLKARHSYLLEDVLTKDLDLRFDGNEHSVLVENLPEGFYYKQNHSNLVDGGIYLIETKIYDNKLDELVLSFNNELKIYYEVIYYKLNEKQSFNLYDKTLTIDEFDTSLKKYEFLGFYLDNLYEHEMLMPFELKGHITLHLKYDLISNLKFEDKEVTYNKEYHNILVEDLPNGYYVEYENNNHKNAGIYLIKAYVYEYETDLKVKELEATLTINKKELDLTFEDKEIKYDGNAHSLKVNGDLPDDILINYTKNEFTHPGKYKVTAIILTNGNYINEGFMEAYLNIYYEVTYHNLYEEVVHKNYNTWLEQEEIDTTYEDYEFKGYFLDDSFENKLPNKYHLDGHTNIYMKYDHTLDLKFNDKEFIYNGLAHNILVTGLDDDYYEVIYKNNNKKEVGKHLVEALIYDKRNNKLIDTLKAYIIINDVSFDISLNDETHTYNDIYYELTIDGNIPNGYEVIYDNNKHKNAGTYLVKALIKDLLSEKIVKTYEATLTINPKEVNVELKDKEIKYDGSEHKLEVTGDLPDNVLVEYTNNNKTHPGRHLVNVIILTSDNYVVKGKTKAYLNIYYEVTYHNLYEEVVHKNYDTWLEGPKLNTTYNDYEFKGYFLDDSFENELPNKYHLDGHMNIYMKYDHTLDLKFNNKEVTYDGETHFLKLTGLTDNFKVEYENNDQVNAGLYEVIAKVYDKRNNKLIDTLKAYIIINDVSFDISLNDETHTYNDIYYELTIDGNIPNGYEVIYDNNKHKDAGTYLVKALIKDLLSEKIVKTYEATLTINPKEVNVELKDKDIKYDGSEHKLEVTGDLPDNVLVEYTNNNKTHPGRYLVNVIILTSNNYVVKGKTKAYLNIYYEVTYHNLYEEVVHKNYDTWLEGPKLTITYNDYEFKGYFLDDSFENELPNKYHLDGHMNIYMKYDHTLDLKFNNKEVTYDGETHFLKLTGLTDNFKVEYENNDQVNAGLYEVIAKVYDKENNKLVETLIGTLKINKKELNLIFEGKDVKYDGNAHSLKVNGDLSEDISINYTINEFTHPGKYKVTAIILTNGNYINEGLMEAHLNIYYEITYKHPEKDIVVKSYDTWIDEHNVDTTYNNYIFEGFYLDKNYNHELPNMYHLDGHTNFYMKYKREEIIYENVIRDGNNVLHPDGTPVLIPNYKQQAEEIRGIWISTVFNIDVNPIVNGNIESYKNHIKEILDNVKLNNFNTIFFQIRSMNDAYYYSDLAPISKYLTGTEGLDPGFDVLSFIIEEAHNRNLQLHGWLNPYRVASSDLSFDSMHEDNLAIRRPDLVITDGHGRYILNPGEVDVQNYIKDIVKEVLTKHPNIDGIHFDDYFYLDTLGENSSSPDYQTYLNNRTNSSQTIADFRRMSVTNMVELVYNEVEHFNNNNNKKVKFGISPSGIWANDSSNSLGSNTNGYEHNNRIYANSLEWIEKEIIHYIIPQIYWSFTLNVAPYAHLVDWWSNVTENTNVELIIGIGLYKANEVDWIFDEIPEQLIYLQNHENIIGSSMFSYQDILTHSDVMNFIKNKYWIEQNQSVWY